MRKHQILLAILVSLCKSSLASVCFEHNNIFAPQQLSPTEDSDCWSTSISNKISNVDGVDPITVDFTCLGASDAACDKASKAFKLATERIATVVNFVTPISVNASFLPICDIDPSVCPPGYQVLGAAAPTKSFVLQDDDGVQRVYPQALTRQFTNLPNFFNFAEYDIQAQFNSEAAFWFTNDSAYVPSTSTDFNYVVLHELFHGLGIISAWQNYIGSGYLTPNPNLEPDDSNTFVFGGFLETAFDRFLYDSTAGQYLTTQTKKLNSLGMQITQGETDSDGIFNDDGDADDPSLGVIDEDYVVNQTNIEPFPIDVSLPASLLDKHTFKHTSRIKKLLNSRDIFLSSFRTSDRLTSLASDISYRATTASLPPLIFAPLTSDNTTSPMNQSFNLESHLSPFRPGSSLNHFDYKTYSSPASNTTAEFLLTWLISPGVSLQNLINASDAAASAAAQNQNSQVDVFSLATVNSTGIGPGLVHILASIGYQIRVPLPLVVLDFDRKLPPSAKSMTSASAKFAPPPALLSPLLLLIIYLYIV